MANFPSHVLSAAIRRLRVSPTVKVAEAARSLKARGIEIHDLGIGEPLFPTPDHIKQAGIEAIEKNLTRYDDVEGLSTLRKVILDRARVHYCADAAQTEVIITNGVKQAIFNAFAATIDPGDEVVCPCPGWVSYQDIAQFFGARPVLLRGDESVHFKWTAAELEQALTAKTKWIVLNSPCNPTGAVYSRKELEQLASVIRRHPSLLILSDDIYNKILLEPIEWVNLVSVDSALWHRVLVVDGFSKSHCMPGWRVGFAVGPRDLVRAMAKVQGQSTLHGCTVSQAAAVVGYVQTDEFITKNNQILAERRDYLSHLLAQIPGFRWNHPMGGFYLFVSVEDYIGLNTKEGIRICDDVLFSKLLLESAHTAVVPGSAFGCPGYIRVSFSATKVTIQSACQNIRKVCGTFVR